MKLYEGELYWPTTVNVPTFKSLSKDKKCDITIIGTGMAGILCAYELSQDDHKIILIDANEIASKSSRANAGLLQFSSDITLFKLAKQIGERDAVLFYKMCLEAMQSFKQLPKSIINESDFHARDSLYLASNEDDLIDLQNEYKILRKHDFLVQFLNRNDLKQIYNINAAGALLTKEDVEINPLKFIVALVKQLINNGVSIYENSKVLSISYNNDEAIVETKNATIKSKHVIIATGYSKNLLKNAKEANLVYTYTIATNVLNGQPWKDNTFIWESAIPYLYARVTKDNRIIAGGLDIEKNHASDIEHNFLIKGEAILKKLKALIPTIHAEPKYTWKAVFGVSSDSLPYIGRDPDHKNTYYCLGYGGNGTIFSMAGAKIIRDLINKNKNPYSHIVKVDR